LYNNREAAHVTGARIFAVSHLLEACHYLQGKTKLTPNPIESAYTHYVSRVDMNEVVGQFQARRALEIAAAGRHSVLMSGPPGTGKTMLASRLPGLLPPMSEKEAVETAAIHSVSHQGFHHSLWCERPYRNPHHTSSAVALVGGGSHPRPGEISLAHNGILFLDELPEFDRKVLEVLREPIESGYISISRAARKIRYPARFQLIAAMNPCPCGYFGDKKRSCSCSIEQVSRYRSRVSGPLMDRIDIQLQLQRLNQDEAINGNSMAESSEDIRKRVVAATHCQLARQGKVNSELGSLEIAKNCRISEKDQLFLNAALEKLQLSMRAYHRVLKLSRTIADLECETEIRTSHISEALGYRCLDRGLRA
ncbi:MAG: YifB family Mg chelatase-like AAA ATPase, partial [Gammaproteobacteria bacterium]|nr:YifB family Mg chelatase-like AAA ATPase [Gammaproteobacteria bacterium]